MSYGEPAPSAARHHRATVYSVHGRRRALLGSGLVLALVATALAAGAHPHDGTRPMPPARHHAGASSGDAMSAVSWPEQGQAALVLGGGRPAASPDQQPAPIASLAKVMTAYLTLKRYPLPSGQDGFTITLGAEQAQEEAEDARRAQSVVAVQAGEELTERQLLEALLIPSGNNIARTLSAVVAGGETRFVAEMNAEAHVLGMAHTTYTDPSGWDQGTVSTAADQLRVLRQAMRFSAFRQIVSMARVTLPVAGTLKNFNPLVSSGYAGKTGSDSAAGGCLAFFTRVTVGGRRVTAAGVVMGQGDGSDTSNILAAAGDAAERLVGSVADGEGGQAAPPVGADSGPRAAGGDEAP